jgi:hypothetical protein
MRAGKKANQIYDEGEKARPGGDMRDGHRSPRRTDAPKMRLRTYEDECRRQAAISGDLFSRIELTKLAETFHQSRDIGVPLHATPGLSKRIMTL